MTTLKWQNVNLTTGQIKVVEGKGFKDRMVYVDESTINDLRGWGETPYVFTTRYLTKLLGRYVRDMIKTYSAKAGIKKHITTHSFRHTFASDLLRDCTNIRIVQKTLGHSDIATTQIYTHIVDIEVE